MDIKALLLNPITFAAAGGFAGHRFYGKKEPMWAPVGGAVAGAILGYYLQKALAPKVPVKQIEDKENPPPVSGVDFTNLPLPEVVNTQTYPNQAADVVPDVTPEDSLGSYGGGLSENGAIGDDVIDEILAETKDA
jgi:hypothetical protein